MAASLNKNGSKSRRLQIYLVCGHGLVSGLLSLGPTIYGAGREYRQPQRRNRVLFPFVRVGSAVLAALRVAIWKENHISYLDRCHDCRLNTSSVSEMKSADWI